MFHLLRFQEADVGTVADGNGGVVAWTNVALLIRLSWGELTAPDTAAIVPTTCTDIVEGGGSDKGFTREPNRNHVY